MATGKRISALPSIVTPTLNDYIPEVQPAVGGTTYKATIAQINDVILDQVAGSANIQVALAANTLTITFIDGDQIVGTTTNDNATAGNIGEYLSTNVLIGAAVPLTSTVAANLCSVALTSGDWDCWGLAINVPAAGTTTEAFVAGINTVSATIPTPSPTAGFAGLTTIPSTADQIIAQPVPACRLSLAAPTTVYLVVRSTFSVSTQSVYGFIAARRRR